MLRIVFSGVLICILILTAAPCSSDTSATTQEEKHKEIVAWIYENGVNAHNPDAWDEILTEDFVRHCEAMPAPMREIRGLEEMKSFLAGIFAAMPDWHEEIQNLVAEGDIVAFMSIGNGTLTGQFGGMPATGKSAEITSMVFLRFENEKVAEAWVTWDNVYFLEQLGLFSPPGQPVETQ